MMGRTIAAAVIISMPVAAPAAHAAYTVVDLGPVALSGEAQAVNENGLAVGEFSTAAGTQGFSCVTGTKNTFGTPSGDTALFGVNSGGIAVGMSGNNGVMLNAAVNNSPPTSVGTFGGPTVAYGINDTGLIVGESQYPTTVGYAFSTQAGTGTLTPLTPASQHSPGSSLLGAAGSTALAVNNAGTIVGNASAGSPVHAFLYTGGKMFDIGTLGADPAEDSTAYAINTGGTIVGSSYDSDGNLQAFEYSNYSTNPATGTATGTLTALGFLDPVNNPVSEAYAINNNGLIVGYSEDDNGDELAVEFTGGTPVALDSLLGPADAAHWTLESAQSVNNAGQIVGYGLYDGTQQAFLLQPTSVPEPVSGCVAMMITAALCRRRRTGRPPMG
jgi:probable HAF family extracellular repeat protein